jgi:hypothetical protein
MRRFPRLAKAVLLLGSTVFGLACLEIGLRLLPPAGLQYRVELGKAGHCLPEEGTTADWKRNVRDNEVIGYAPNSAWECLAREFHTHVEIDIRPYLQARAINFLGAGPKS